MCDGVSVPNQDGGRASYTLMRVVWKRARLQGSVSSNIPSKSSTKRLSNSVNGSGRVDFASPRSTGTVSISCPRRSSICWRAEAPAARSFGSTDARSHFRSPDRPSGKQSLRRMTRRACVSDPGLQSREPCPALSLRISEQVRARTIQRRGRFLPSVASARSSVRPRVRCLATRPPPLSRDVPCRDLGPPWTMDR